MSLPVAPDGGAINWYSRPPIGVLLVCGAGVLALTFVGSVSSPRAVLEATVVDWPTTDAPVSDATEHPADGPLGEVVDGALSDESASVETTRERVRSAGYRRDCSTW
jgi:hypothetical protein